ncbi:pilus assembly protein [Azoarcus sp. DD4]|uniref:type IV pilin protein n=1 Tax=Azoarcus sp. DD4 TaxID=2027405 RepID=UPI00112BF2E9|nr:type IV pilin protein [Azoarcus sp. DD4]QDF97534.1 pilus assembly protein [Azoarcus sp. DD4]
MTIRSAIRSRSVGARPAGFSLIELMIVVAVIGILAAIAYPNYQEYVVKTNRTAAKSFLMEVAQRQQQYLLDAREYAADLTTLGMTVPADVSRYYTVSITGVAAGDSPPDFVAQAVPIAGSTQANDGNLTVDETGAKTGKW